MKMSIVMICLLIISSMSLWGERVKVGAGYSPTSETLLFMASLPMDGISEKIPGNLYVKLNWMKRDDPEGLQFQGEVWGWDIKERYVLDVLILSLGYSTNILWRDRIYLSPNIGFGHKSRYLQFQQTTLQQNIYSITDRYFSDPGIDMTVYIDDIGITVGTSVHSLLQLGFMIRF